MTKTLILFYSTYGTNHAMAKIAQQALLGETRLRKIAETAPQSVIDSQEAWKTEQENQKTVETVTPEDIEWADAIIFSFPTRFGSIPSQARAFIDTLGGLWATGKLANKTVTAMTSAQNPHGGQETTLLSLYTSLMHWGAIIVAPGYTHEDFFKAGGNPYGTSQTGSTLSIETENAIKEQAKRLETITKKLKS